MTYRTILNSKNPRIDGYFTSEFETFAVIDPVPSPLDFERGYANFRPRSLSPEHLSPVVFKPNLLRWTRNERHRGDGYIFPGGQLKFKTLAQRSLKVEREVKKGQKLPLARERTKGRHDYFHRWRRRRRRRRRRQRNSGGKNKKKMDTKKKRKWEVTREEDDDDCPRFFCEEKSSKSHEVTHPWDIQTLSFLLETRDYCCFLSRGSFVITRPTPTDVIYMEKFINKGRTSF